MLWKHTSLHTADGASLRAMSMELLILNGNTHNKASALERSVLMEQKASHVPLPPPPPVIFPDPHCPQSCLLAVPNLALLST